MQTNNKLLYWYRNQCWLQLDNSIAEMINSRKGKIETNGWLWDTWINGKQIENKTTTFGVNNVNCSSTTQLINFFNLEQEKLNQQFVVRHWLSAKTASKTITFWYRNEYRLQIDNSIYWKCFILEVERFKNNSFCKKSFILFYEIRREERNEFRFFYER